jgi:Tol biopolymer transport system component
MNWNPVWSPDGNYLYYASNRGGNMNVWRIAINEKTGEVLGEPEAVTTPSSATWNFRFCRNGNSFVYVNNERRFLVYRLDFDPVQEKIKGLPEPVIQGTKKLSFIGPSPDGEWLAYGQTEPQSDLFVVRKDGSGMRQLTNDPYGDMSPAWSPDGKRIAFHSSRGGKGDIWMVNVDGSNLQQVTDDAGEMPAKPVWFPDGKRLAVLGMKKWNTLIVDLSKPLPARTLQSLACEDTLIKHFWPTSVSADGNMLAGMSEESAGAYVYHMSTRTLQRQIEPGMWPMWLNDSRRFLYTGNAKNILVFDMNTRKSHEIMEIPSGSLGDFKISNDSKNIFYMTQSSEADIWLATLK